PPRAWGTEPAPPLRRLPGRDRNRVPAARRDRRAGPVPPEPPLALVLVLHGWGHPRRMRLAIGGRGLGAREEVAVKTISTLARKRRRALGRATAGRRWRCPRR